MKKTIKIYIWEKELSYYLSQIQPLDISYDTNGQYFLFNYNEWRKLYVKTLPSIDKIYYNKLEVIGDDKSR